MIKMLKRNRKFKIYHQEDQAHCYWDYTFETSYSTKNIKEIQRIWDTQQEVDDTSNVIQTNLLINGKVQVIWHTYLPGLRRDTKTGKNYQLYKDMETWFVYEDTIMSLYLREYMATKQSNVARPRPSDKLIFNSLRITWSKWLADPIKE